MNTSQLHQAKNAIKHFKYFDANRNHLILTINGYLENLLFIPDTANKFEESLRILSLYLGFVGQRPEAEFGKGPDVLWGVGNLEYFVIECKNGATTDTICKDYCNQLNGSMNWFSEKYDATCTATPILIHPSNNFEYAASPHKDMRIMTTEKLASFKESIRLFIKAVSSLADLDDTKKITELLDYHSLTPKKLVGAFTVKFSVKTKSK